MRTDAQSLLGCFPILYGATSPARRGIICFAPRLNPGLLSCSTYHIADIQSNTPILLLDFLRPLPTLAIKQKWPPLFDLFAPPFPPSDEPSPPRSSPPERSPSLPPGLPATALPSCLVLVPRPVRSPTSEYCMMRRSLDGRRWREKSNGIRPWVKDQWRLECRFGRRDTEWRGYSKDVKGKG